MAAGGPEAKRAVQVVAHRQDGTDWFGSGYLVTGDLVITAQHVVGDADDVTIRFIDAPGRVRSERGKRVWAHTDIDLAVVRLYAAMPGTTPVQYGRLFTEAECEAVGYPWFKLRGEDAQADAAHPGKYRDSHHARATSTPLSNTRSGTLELAVAATPSRHPDPERSAWEGMSGAAVFADGALIAVLTDNFPEEGPGLLAARPVEHWYMLPPDRLSELHELIGVPDADRLIQVSAQTPPWPDRPRQLPARRPFVGREKELSQLLGLLAPGAVSAPAAGTGVAAIVGLPGVGKTALVTEAGHVALERGWFRGGQLFRDMRGYDPEPLSAHDTLAQLLLDLGVPTNEIRGEEQARAAQFRSKLAQSDAPMLIVLDNVSRVRQVVPLLPTEGPHRVLVTSRHNLHQLDARLLRLNVLSPDECAALMDTVLRNRSEDDNRIQEQPEAAAEIARLCGYLPLALRIATALLADVPAKPLAELADQLAEQGARLDRLDDEENAVRAAFDLSYQRLAADEAKLFRLLSLNGGPDISAAAAAAVAGLDRPATARTLLDRLAAAHLLDTADRSRWTMHDLLWEYAALAAAKDPEHSREEARGRLIDYYNQSFVHAAAMIRPSAEIGRPRVAGHSAEQFASAKNAVDWLITEHTNLVAAIATASKDDDHERRYMLNELAKTLAAADREGDAWRVWKEASSGEPRRPGSPPESITDLYAGNPIYVRHSAEIDLQVEELNAARRAVDEAQRSGDRRAEADGLLRRSVALRKHRMDIPEARQLALKAAAIFAGLHDTGGEARAYYALGQAHEDEKLTGEARTDYETAERLAKSARATQVQAQALERIGSLLTMMGQQSKAIVSLRRSIELFQLIDDARGEGRVMSTLGITLLDLGQYDDAVTACRDAIALCYSAGEIYGRLSAQMNLSTALCRAGRYQESIAESEEALAMCRDFHYPEGEINALLELGFACLNEARYEESVRWYEQAVALLTAPGNGKREALAQFRLGLALSCLGRWHEGNQAYERAREVFNQEGDRNTAALTLALLGGNLVDSGHPERGIPRLHQALEEADQIGDTRVQQLAMRNLEIAQAKLA